MLEVVSGSQADEDRVPILCQITEADGAMRQTVVLNLALTG